VTTALELRRETMNIRRLHVASLTLLGLAACSVSAPIQERIHRDPGLLDSKTTDIAVLKIEDATAGNLAGPVVESMRAAIEKALIDRYYTPLRSIHVDAHIRDAVAPGGSIVEATFLKSIAKKAEEDAILAVRIKRWDQGTLLLNNRVAFDAQVVLFGSKAGKVLWSLDIWGEVVAGGGKAAPQDPARRAEAAAKEFAKEITDRLPERKS
jgi:hypothetical protein